GVVVPAYTPTAVDLAAVEDDEQAGASVPAGAGQQAVDDEPGGESRSEGPSAQRDIVAGQDGNPPQSGRATGVRPSAPLRIAEQIRAAYAREARF
ncbi:hypothetical protein AB4212_37080, partial [Streptomyces sp. 2MCAF27]